MILINNSYNSDIFADVFIILLYGREIVSDVITMAFLVILENSLYALNIHPTNKNQSLFLIC